MSKNRAVAKNIIFAVNTFKFWKLNRNFGQMKQKYLINNLYKKIIVSITFEVSNLFLEKCQLFRCQNQ